MFRHKSPKALADAVRKIVSGQDQAVNHLAAYIFLYIMGHYAAFTPGNEINYKPNALLMGNSGSGKTFLTKTIAEQMEFNFIEINSKELSGDGSWSGTSFRNKLIEAVFTNLSVAQTETPWTIIFIDEFDKLCQPLSSSRDDTYNQHIQNSLLKPIEARFIQGEWNKAPARLDASKLCFVLAGNFQDIRDKRDKKKSIGFHNHSEDESKLRKELEEFGMIPELIGRMSHLIELNELTPDDYGAIINNDHFFFNRYLRVMQNLGFKDLDYNRQEVIERADTSRLGVRAIIQEFSLLLNDLINRNNDNLELMTKYFQYREGKSEIIQTPEDEQALIRKLQGG